jgi:hypothetical protein
MIASLTQVLGMELAPSVPQLQEELFHGTLIHKVLDMIHLGYQLSKPCRKTRRSMGT